MKHSRAAFTLLEICLAVMIALMIATLAVPTVSGIVAENKLKATLMEFDDFVQDARARSVKERLDLVMYWRNEGIELIAAELRDEDEENGGIVATFPFAKDRSYGLERPATMLNRGEEAPPEWTFWRSGVCEPVVVSYKGHEGVWRVRYDALTVHPEILEQTIP